MGFDFLTKDDELDIVEAIKKAEKETSGEIRVHIEATTEKEAFERAKEVFHDLGMDATELKNGVLIYMAYLDHTFVICGDRGIDDAVPDDFWDCTRDVMQQHFRKGEFKAGFIAGIARAGEKLQEFFPWQEDDTDELSNEISRS